MVQQGGPEAPIYLDHHATTPVDPRVLEAMLPYLREDFGNAASSAHVYGWRAEAAVEDARERIAAAIGAEPREVVWTSGATESNNLAILGAAEASRRRRRVVTVTSEHPAVLDPCRYLARQGSDLIELAVDGRGLLDPAAVEAALSEDTLLVSVMAANNEIGVLQPIDEIGRLCRARGVLFHTDAAQAVGRIPIDVDAACIDLLSISGHKIYGPKGVGALFVRSRRPRARIAPRQHGGGHERGLRSGTLPVPLIVGMARALELCLAEREAEAARLLALRDRLWQRLEAELPGLRINGDTRRRLPGNLNVAFEDVDGERLLLALSGVAVSSGSACASARPEPSHVLAAIGLPEKLARASLRFGLGRGTTEDEIDRAAARVIDEVRKERGI
ncbi:MAG: cysteine desulfurase [Deltaproteobacteria bacterium]|nr:cysteine desulfurase [Deltaproteobacteria bacterium]